MEYIHKRMDSFLSVTYLLFTFWEVQTQYLQFQKKVIGLKMNTDLKVWDESACIVGR
jgi:hypothetical protein